MAAGMLSLGAFTVSTMKAGPPAVARMPFLQGSSSSAGGLFQYGEDQVQEWMARRSRNDRGNQLAAQEFVFVDSVEASTVIEQFIDRVDANAVRSGHVAALGVQDFEAQQVCGTGISAALHVLVDLGASPERAVTEEVIVVERVFPVRVSLDPALHPLRRLLLRAYPDMTELPGNFHGVRSSIGPRQVPGMRPSSRAVASNQKAKRGFGEHFLACDERLVNRKVEPFFADRPNERPAHAEGWQPFGSNVRELALRCALLLSLEWRGRRRWRRLPSALVPAVPSCRRPSPAGSAGGRYSRWAG